MRAKVASASRPKSTPLPIPNNDTSSIHPLARPDTPSHATSSTTKKDKRQSKHNALVSRIEKSHSKTPKRRRPSKKLAQLESLADALPDLEDDDDDDEWEGINSDAEMGGDNDMLGALGKMVRVRKRGAVVGEGKMKMKTLKSRPGAAKRKARLEEGEMERFRRNLAGMAPVVRAERGEPQGQASGGLGDRWAALRGFIGQTMEQNAAFRKA